MDAAGDFEHEGHDEGFDLILLGIRDAKVIKQEGPMGEKVVF